MHKACIKSGLDPDSHGTNNPWANSRPNSTFEEPFDLSTIGFSKKHLKEVNKIGQLIYNLLFQKQDGEMYIFQSKEEVRDSMIEKIITTLKESMAYWFAEGLMLPKIKDNKLVLHNGKVYEFDTAFMKAMNEIDEKLVEFRRDFGKKEAESIESVLRVRLKRLP